MPPSLQDALLQAMDVLRHCVSDGPGCDDAAARRRAIADGEAALRAAGVAVPVPATPFPARPILLPAALRSMLDRIAAATDRNGSLMAIAITSSGGSEPRKLSALIRIGWVERCDHHLPRGPVDGVRVTEAGRVALRAGPLGDFGVQVRRRTMVVGTDEVDVWQVWMAHPTTGRYAIARRFDFERDAEAHAARLREVRHG